MANIEKRPTLEWVPVKKLFIDKKYQRSSETKPSRENIVKIKANFSWALFGALVVFRSNDKYAVVDGQHRVEAAKILKLDELPCVIVDNQDIKAQAQSFVGINKNRLSVHTLAKFKAALASEDENAMMVKKICDAAGITILEAAAHGDKTGPRETQAVGTMLSLVRKYTEAQLIWTLKIIPEAYGDEKGKLRALSIKAVAKFLKDNPEAFKERRADAVRTLQETNLKELEINAEAAVKIQGGNKVNMMVEGLEREYTRTAKSAGKKLKPVAEEDRTPPPSEPTGPLVKYNADADDKPKDPNTEYDIDAVSQYLDQPVDYVLRLLSRGKLEQPASDGKWLKAQLDRYLDKKTEGAKEQKKLKKYL